MCYFICMYVLAKSLPQISIFGTLDHLGLIYNTYYIVPSNNNEESYYRNSSNKSPTPQKNKIQKKNL